MSAWLMYPSQASSTAHMSLVDVNGESTSAMTRHDEFPRGAERERRDEDSRRRQVALSALAHAAVNTEGVAETETEGTSLPIVQSMRTPGTKGRRTKKAWWLAALALVVAVGTLGGVLYTHLRPPSRQSAIPLRIAALSG